MKRSPRFPLGQTLITPNAHQQLTATDVYLALYRHTRGDWGDLCEEDIRANEESLKEGTRLLSAYISENGPRFWVITEADRSATTILMPEDY